MNLPCNSVGYNSLFLGKGLPSDMKGVVAVPYQKTFLLVGGRTQTYFSHYFLDGVFWYNGARDVWQRCRGPDSISMKSKSPRKFPNSKYVKNA